MTNPGRPSVIIAVSDPADRAALDMICVELGYVTISVGTDVAALRAFQNFRAGIVIVDLLSPDVDGLELCARVREFAADQCATMAIASADRPHELCRALEAGMDDAIARPLAPGLIAARLLVLDRLVAARRAGRIARFEAARLRWLAGVGQTALTFQHEISNPLTALYGHLEMLEQSGRLDGQEMQDLTNAVTQARQIEAAVSHFVSGYSNPAVSRHATS